LIFVIVYKANIEITQVSILGYELPVENTTTIIQILVTLFFFTKKLFWVIK